MTGAVESAIILAGGLGTRLRSVVSDLPKPMAPIAGRPFLAHQLDYWIGQGVRRFVLSVGYQHERISGFFGESYNGASLDYVVETTPLGTGGGLLLAADRLGDDTRFLLLNGDTYFKVDIGVLFEAAETSDADWCFSLFRTSEKGRYMGMTVGPDGRITSLNAGTDDASRLANGGVYLVHPRALRGSGLAAGKKISLEDDIFPAAIASGRRLVGVEFPGTFIDIGVPADFERAQSLFSVLYK